MCRRGICVKNLLPGTKPQGFAVSGEPSANHAGRRASNPEIPGPRFAPGNRKQRVSGEPSANHAGRRASNSEILGPRFATGNRKQRVSGEPSANHAGRRAHFAYRRTCKYARRAHPTFGGPVPAVPRARPTSQRAGPQQKNTGRQPGVYSYPIIPAIPADPGRFPRILPGTLSAAEALLRCPLRGWLPRSAEAPDRAGTSAGGTNRCGRSDRN